jgi:hypothetical protein
MAITNEDKHQTRETNAVRAMLMANARSLAEFCGSYCLFHEHVRTFTDLQTAIRDSAWGDIKNLIERTQRACDAIEPYRVYAAQHLQAMNVLERLKGICSHETK